MASMDAHEQDRVSGQVPDDSSNSLFSKNLLGEFEKHSEQLRARARARRAAVQLRSVINDREEREQVSEEDMLGRRQPRDEYQGDVNMRTLRALLKMIDEKGYERSPHQMQFHSAFERSTARVLYKDVSEAIIKLSSMLYTDTFVCSQDWGTQRPAIMKKNGWDKCSSEVLISTPRRFGKVCWQHLKTHDCCHTLVLTACHLLCANADVQHRDLRGMPRADDEMRDRGFQVRFLDTPHREDMTDITLCLLAVRPVARRASCWSA